MTILIILINVSGIIKPGADVATLSNFVKDTVLNLRKNDVLVFSGDANDISKNYSKMGLRHVLNFVRNKLILILFYLVYPIDTTWQIGPA
jgi:hypothetical protein